MGSPRCFAALWLAAHAAWAYPRTCLTARARGLACVDENVTTSDGFILQVHRVEGVGGGPDGTGGERKVALLQHGLVDSSETWVANYGNGSLAFQLADRGWTVYLANSRGREPYWHETLKAADPAFWAWSWDEMAALDLPATVDHVLARTGAERLSYAGHSQGTTLAMVGASINASLAARLDVVALLAPVGILRHGNFGNITRTYELGKWLCARVPETCDEGIWDALHDAAPVVCDRFGYPLCVDAVCDVAGCRSHDGYNESVLVDVVFAHSYFAGTSFRNLAHFEQMEQRNATEVRKFDFGNASANVAAYGRATPPAYDLSKFAGKAAAFVGTADRMVPEADALETLALLTSAKFAQPTALLEGYGHGDFIWSLDAATRLYPRIVALFEEARL